MSEDRDLLSRIAQLAGHINLHKVQMPRGKDFGTNGPRSWLHNNGGSIQDKNTQPVISGFTPHHTAGHMGRVSSHPHRNRSLVLNNIAPPPKGLEGSAAAIEDETSCNFSKADNQRPQPTTSWVSKRDRHMQLINSAVYDKQANLRSKAIDHSRQNRALRKGQREKFKNHKQHQQISNIVATKSSTNHPPLQPAVHELSIGGLRFRVSNDGSKLVRCPNEIDLARPTPRRALIGGVTFMRSRHGNLYRSGLVTSRRGYPPKIEVPELCKRFTTTGRCSKGPSCHFIHDPEKVTICPVYLQNGECPNGVCCDLSHKSSPERVPACLHFLRGKCSKATCRYAHVWVNPSAPICRSFATLGYCSLGALCKERHVIECPEYASSGNCRSKKCRLPHVDRAAQIRQYTAKNANNAVADQPNGHGGDEKDDLSSEKDDTEGGLSDDVDSDGLGDDSMAEHHHANKPLFGQENFIRF